MSREDIKYCLLLCLSTVLSYFQLVLNIFPTKWDNLSAFFPYRYTAMHWWRNGHIPLWDPYQNFGYPMHSNPQGAVWYPVTWLFGLVKGYTQYSMNLELVFHVFIAGIGMYFFLKANKLTGSISFIGALMYSLSGFISGTSHMIGFTAGAAWLPWCLLFFILVYQTRQYLFMALLSLVCFLQLTGAYTAFSIVLVYIFIVLGVYYILTSKSKLKTFLFSLKVAFTCSVLTLFISGPYLYSIYDSLEYFSRASPLDYDPNNFSSNFNWQCFQSLFAPYIISASQGFKGIDVSMANIFISLPGLAFVFYYFTKSKKTVKKIFLTLATSGAALLMLGNNTPIHKWSTIVIPGFDLFRHPYLFGVYVTFGLILCASFGIKNFLSNYTKPKISKFILAIPILLFLTLAYKTNFCDFSSYLEHWHNLRERSPLNNYGHVIIQIGSSYILFMIFYFLFKKYGYHVKVISVYILLELFIAIQLNGPLNMYYNIPSKNIEDYVNEQGNVSLTNQETNTPLSSLQNRNITPTVGLWSNLNTFKRTTGIDGYNPFIFRSTEVLQKSPLYPGVISNGLVYSSDSCSVSKLKLGFNAIRFDINLAAEQVIHISQNYHHNWRAELDGRLIDIQKDKNGLMTIQAPAVIGTLKLVYESLIIKRLVYLQLISLCILLLLVTLKPTIIRVKLD